MCFQIYAIGECFWGCKCCCGLVGMWECGNLGGGSVHMLMDLFPHMLMDLFHHLGSPSYTKLYLFFDIWTHQVLGNTWSTFCKSFTSFYAATQRWEETLFIILILKVHNFVTYMVIRLLYSYKLFPSWSEFPGVSCSLLSASSLSVVFWWGHYFGSGSWLCCFLSQWPQSPGR